MTKTIFATFTGLLMGLSLSATANSAYITDSSGTPIRSGSGECWRATTWSPSQANSICESTAYNMRKPDATGTFEFNRANLNNSTKKSLSRSADRNLKSEGVKEVEVIGYADELGTPAANDKISEERAKNTKDYLVRRGVASSKISTEGRGARKPVTGTKCDGEQGEKLVACLKADRRVEVRAR